MDHDRADGHATDSASRGGPAGAPADQATVRRSNLALVLRHVSANGPCSRSAVAVSTGLNKATVTSLVNELQARGLVKEMGPQHAGSVGRPGVALALDGSRAGALGVEVNVDYIAAIATDLAGRVLIDRRIGFDAMGSGPERSLDELARMVETTVADLGRLGVTPAGITVAVPGLVDTTTGTVVVAPNLGWRGVPVAERLSRVARDIPIAVDNDANLAALAEYTSGVAAGIPDLVCLTGEVGVGGGVISGGRLLGGADGFAGEIGHVMIDPSGERCRCGRVGCWETKVGLAALVRMATPHRPYGTGPQVVRDPEERLAEIEQRRADGDPRAEAAVAEVGRWLGIGAALLINLLNPRVIVLGGYFARLADPLIPAAQRELARTGMSDAVERCRFAASDLGFGAASRGAAGVVAERALSDPTSISIRTSPAAGVIEATPTACSPRSS
ncbi:ROK family transcriptional regulator [Nonomuraea gerenzanensis]|uniref:Xylose-responsive transcription regulator, ROK family n=1 Tax=Nonomuraea gerenzanensis TaxID=93944 RepID=A0A1M4E5V6_9ACTN|nr:ROK family transcriptional regulator [Nonomuraea gerenzanensis]UBU16361.1 ROK family transcriptional regulator [Nonomuraea gerenzanensis]SBO94180.1 Xylose-responsive transcription regulator, ROK family [Nonomuraea gerenzanensis]